MTPEQKSILERILTAGGKVPPNTFRGKGYIVSGMVRRGWLEWERGNLPRTLNATGLLVTDLGRQAAHVNQ